MGRRLFQGFQECVGGLIREHVGFVDDVDLALALYRREIHLLPYIANLVDSPVAGGVQFDDIQKPAFVDGLANGTLVAGVAALGVKAVNGFGQDAGRGGFTAAPGTAKQVGVGHSSLDDGLKQSGANVLLPHKLLKAKGTPFSVVDLGGLLIRFPINNTGLKSLA